MKKLSLVLGALVMTFMLSSCTNKKDAVIKIFNTFFDKEVASLNEVVNADQFLDFLTASEGRFNEFYAMLDKDYPINENDEFIGFSQDESEAAMKVYTDRLEAFEALRDTKGAELFEPYVTKFEDVVNGLVDDILNERVVDENVVDQIQASYDDIDKYFALGSEEQVDRLYEVDDMVNLLFGGDEEEGEE